MSPVAPRKPGAPFAMKAPALALAATAGIVLLFAVLVALGVIDLSIFRAQPPSTAGLIAVPTPARAIPAYTRIRRDHLWDPVNQRISVIYLPPRAVTKEMLRGLPDVMGRVLAEEKAPGYVFTDDDFLPAGTREGLVAGIPAGMRAVRLSADRVEGLYGLNAGDRFDLLATLPIEDTGGGGQSFGFSGPYGSQLALQAQLSNWTKQATVRVIVQNATIVEPMNARGIPLYQTSLTEGASTRVRSVQEAVIAIAPSEVASLTEALAVGARLTTVPRSGRPDDPKNSRTPDLQPFGPFATPGGDLGGSTEAEAFKVVETISGQKRTLTAVPRH